MISSPPPASAAPIGVARYRPRWLVATGLLVATLLVYFNALAVPFFFDDRPAIERNESIRRLWPLTGPLSPPLSSAGAAGRPLVNLSLAFNYAIGGLDPRGYHGFNVLAHALTGLVLWGLVGRTLARTRLRSHSDQLGTATALLWLVHPLQTETVVGIVQRNEILVALFYLLTLYALVRSAEAPRPARWQALAFGACLLGMASKEVMATAPLLALLYDRTFISGSFAHAWRRRWRLHTALGCTWLLLAWLMFRHEQRAGTVGFGLGVSAWHYLLTQCAALTTYLKLAVWPHPLVVDYGIDVVTSLRAVTGRATLIVALLGTTVYLLWRRPRLGFATAAFFVILAPSSSLVPLTTQPLAEHRMYLPLAAILALAVLGVHAVVPRHRGALLAVLLIVLGLLTVRRHGDYTSEERLWRDTLAKVPENPRAHASLAGVLSRAGKWAQALPYYEEAVRLRPDYADAQNDFGAALGKLGRHDQALTHHRRAWQLKPDDLDVRLNLGVALQQAGRAAEAVLHFEAVLAQRPRHLVARAHLGDTLLQLGRPADALRQFEHVLTLEPDAPGAHNNAAVALTALGRAEEALGHYARAAHLQPDNLAVRVNYGDALLRAGQAAGAATQYAVAVRLQPDWPDLHYNLGNIQLQLGQLTAAAGEFATAVRLRPGWVPAHHNLALALTQLGRTAEAIPHYEAILRQEPESAQAHHNLALALAVAGRHAEAITRDEAALRLQPDFAAARRHLQQLRGR